MVSDVRLTKMSLCLFIVTYRSFRLNFTLNMIVHNARDIVQPKTVQKFFFFFFFFFLKN